MSAIPQFAPQMISDRILSPLREVSRRQWIVLAGKGALQTLAVSLAVLLVAAFTLGYFQMMPAIVRIPLSLAAWVAVIWSAVHFLRPALQKWTLSRAAAQVEHSLPSVQERISSAVELSDEQEPQFRGSAQLVAHLVRQAEEDAAAVKPAEIVSNKALVRWAILLAPVVLAWLLLSILKPLPIEAGLYRMLTPWRLALPQALSQIAVLPGDATIAQGDDLEITAKISAEVAKNNEEIGKATMVSKYPSGQTLGRTLQEAGLRQFSTKLDNVQNGFKYMVSTDKGDSPWYTITVNPRPAVASLDLKYDYPSYTAMPSRTELNRDGTVEALVGTKITLTVHATGGPLADTAEYKNQIVIQPNAQDAAAEPIKVSLVKQTDTDYTATIIVSTNATYYVELANSFGLTNKDIKHPHSIIAIPDQVPTIVIQSPAATVTVRPDDTVPVHYIATDDYGVASVEALVQADDKPQKSIKVRLPQGDHRNIKDAWKLSVRAVLAETSVAEAQQISYQLKVTDNRNPDPQFSFSNKQTIRIDRNTESFAQKLDKEEKQKLEQAIDKAIAQLNQAEQKVAPLRNPDPNHQLSPQEKQQAHETQQQLTDTAKDLNQAAKEAEQTPFADVAKKVEKIADNPVQKSAEDVAKAELTPDNAQQRAQEANQAQQEIADARQQLQALKNDVQQAEQKAEAAKALEQAAQAQAEAAKDLAEHPENKAQNEQKQREAIAKLQEALQKDQALQNPQAQQLAQKLAELANKVQDLQKQETAQQDQSAKQEQAQQAQQAANALAEQQKQLDQQINKLAQQEKAELAAAQAQTPSQDQQKALENNLQQNQLAQAAQQAQQQAQQLKQDAQQLQNQANAADPAKTADQQAQAQKDQQNQQAAQQDQNQANQAAQALQQDAQAAAQQSKPPQSNDAAAQQAQAAAQAIEKQADATKAANADVQKQLDTAKQDAQQAAQEAQAAAQAPNAQQAQQDLQKAAQDLQQAGQQLAQAEQKNAQADQQAAAAQDKADAQAAADQAKDLAAQQQAIADAAAQQAQAAAQAQQNAQPPQQAAQAQQQVAQQTQAAEQQAAALQQQAQQANNDNVAQRADQAQQALQDAAKEQQAAAQAQAQGTPDQAAQHQEAAQQDLAKAEADLRGLQNQQLAQADQGQHDAAHPEAGQPDAAHPEAGQPDAAHPEQGQGQEQGHPEQGQGQEQGKPEQGQGQEQGKPEQGQGEHGQGEHGQGQPQTPQQAQAQAAQLAQEAAAAQQQALQPNPQAAQEAAQALAQAAQANAAAQPGQPEQGQPEAGPPEQGEPGNEPGHEKSATPGETLVSGQGISAEQSGGNNGRPESVKALGISSSDWAKLPPLVRKELMNAAQQSGPPAYREMIKNYFVKIAHQQAQPGAAVR